MELSTLGSSTSIIPVGRVLESSSGPMAPNILASGPRVKQVVLGGLFLRMETATKATGSQIRPTEKEPTCMQMGQDMRGSGWKINRRASGRRAGQMAAITKANTKRVRKMVKGSSHGLTGPTIRGSG